jgi:hypothetical protein
MTMKSKILIATLALAAYAIQVIGGNGPSAVITIPQK